jgi:hypothetical protein
MIGGLLAPAARVESVDPRMGASVGNEDWLDDSGRSVDVDARGVVTDVGADAVEWPDIAVAPLEAAGAGGGVNLSRSSRKARASSFLDFAFFPDAMMGSWECRV